jgi:hypothetical protein
MHGVMGCVNTDAVSVQEDGKTRLLATRRLGQLVVCSPWHSVRSRLKRIILIQCFSFIIILHAHAPFSNVPSSSCLRSPPFNAFFLFVCAFFHRLKENFRDKKDFKSHGPKKRQCVNLQRKINNRTWGAATLGKNRVTSEWSSVCVKAHMEKYISFFVVYV